jgi:glycosyltransferase involved in cell wall biosynthesis
MKILVYGINYSPELTGIGKYTGEMVEWMASQGHDVRVITAPPYYPEWKVGERYSSWRYRREEGAATVWRCPLYVPKQPSTLKRLIHLGSFALSSFLPADGAASLEAGSHHRRGADAVLHAGHAPAGQTLRRAHAAAHSGL